MKFKDYKLKLEEADEDRPYIVAYASTFDRDPDSYGDVVAKGAFSNTLKEWQESGLSIPLLFGHRTDDPMMNIGKVVEAEEDEKGLLIKAEFDMDNPKAVKCHHDVLEKTLAKMSFAFDVLDEAPVVLEDGRKANELREMRLHEVSLVPIPANQHALVIDAKSEEKAGRRNSAKDEQILEHIGELAEEIQTEVNALMGADDMPTDEETEKDAEEPTEAKCAQHEEPSDANAESEEPEEEGEKENIEAEAKADAVTAKEQEMNQIINEIGTNEVEITETNAKSLGEHAAKSVANVVKGERFSVTSTPFKAATDVHTIGVQGATTDYDKTVYGPRQIAGVADLFASETRSGNALTYYVEGEAEGDFAVVAEGGKKPQISMPPVEKTVALKKIAGFLKESDEIISDAPWMASAINNRGIYKLKVKEENVLVADLLATSGLGTMTKGGATLTIDDILKAKTQVKNASGMTADAVIINPTDYDNIVLGSLTSHYAVNPWSGEAPRLWGMTVCESSAVPSGTCVVGAFKQCGSVVRNENGVSVVTTNSNSDDFEHNLVSIRIEERMVLAVRMPFGFVKVA